MQGLDYAPSREWLLMADLYDLTARAHYKKPKPYPRPWPSETDRKRIGNAGGRTRDEVLAILASVGHAV